MTNSADEIRWDLFNRMLYCRFFENEVSRLWRQGKISGEMHLGTGEEGIIAGVVSHLQPGDALALDHRGTAAILLHGVDPSQVLWEILGDPRGLGKGQGGHMHLMSRKHLAASSGIVGASGPAGAGFGLAAQILRPGSVSVTFFGEGALNQGMLMESFNLAVAWNLPVIFVCKDDQWAITTNTQATSRVTPPERARGFGLPVYTVDGNDVEAVFQSAGKAIQQARNGGGPAFLHASCSHFEGHMVDFQLVRLGRRPIIEILPLIPPIFRGLFSFPGAKMGVRIKAVGSLLQMIYQSSRQHKLQAQEPILHLKRKLLQIDPTRVKHIEQQVREQISVLVKTALQPAEEVSA